MDDFLQLYRQATETLYDDLHGFEPTDIDNEGDGDERGLDLGLGLGAGASGSGGDPNESDLDDDLVVEMDEDGDDDDEEEEGEADEDWTDVTNGIARTPRNVVFEEDVGPRTGIPTWSTGFDYFSLFFDDSFFDMLATETNRYAEFRQRQANKADKYWKPVTVSEIRIYLAINVMMGINVLPQVAHYWSSDDSMRNEAIASVMGRSRYEKIHQYFHLRDPADDVPRGQDGHDPLYKVRPMIDLVRQRSKDLYYPQREVSIDEAMIGFRGRLHFKQYMKGKPTPWGIKVWCIADPSCGYMLDVDIYTGKSAKQHPNGMGFGVVTSIGEPYLDKGHHFFYDNYFASVNLSSHLLLERRTHSCGTIRPSRKGWPVTMTEKATSKMKPGDFKIAQKGPLTATVWRDKRKVSVLSTNVTPAMVTVSRRAPGGHKDVLAPTSVLAYNRFMFGVDLADQLRSYYGMGRSSVKWWRYVFWFLFQVAIVNSWILFKMSNRPEPKSRIPFSHLQFRLNLFRALIDGQVSRKRRYKDALSTAGQAIPDPAEHQLIRLQGLKKSCVECRVNGKKTTSGRNVTTCFGCSLCKVHLCRGHCFAQFHARLHRR